MTKQTRKQEAPKESKGPTHALFHIEADLRWIDMTAARLTQLRDEVLA